MKAIDKNTIKTFATITIIIGVITLVLIGAISYVSGVENQRKYFIDASSQFTDLVEMAFDESLNYEYKNLNIITNDRFLKEYLESEYNYAQFTIARRYVERSFSMFTEYNYIKLERMDSDELIELKRDISKDYNFEQIDYKIFEDKNYYLSKIIENDNKLIYHITVPVYDNFGEIIGMAHVEVDCSQFAERFIEDISFGDSGHIVFVDSNRKVIGYEEDEKNTGEIVNDLLNNYEKYNLVLYEGRLYGEDKLYLLNELNLNSEDSVYIIFIQDKDEVFRYSNSLLKNIFNGSILGFFIYVLAIGITIKKYSRIINDDAKVAVDVIIKTETNDLRKLAEIDGLTGLYNHKTIHEKMERRIKYSKEKLSVLMLDIDLFKIINDKYGHQIGDQVLESVSDILVESTRYCDLVGRYGGEEFIILLEGLDREDSYSISERIRKKVEVSLFTDHNIRLTISIGIAIWSDQSVGELIGIADKNLYKSKINGRNKITT